MHDKSAVRGERSSKVKRSCRDAPGHHSVRDVKNCTVFKFLLVQSAQTQQLREEHGVRGQTATAANAKRTVPFCDCHLVIFVNVSFIYLFIFRGWGRVLREEGGARASERATGKE